MKSWRTRLAISLPRAAIVCHDLVMVWLCWHGLHWLRYAMVPGAPSLPWWSTESFIVLVAQGLVFWRVGLYRGLWRFASVPDLGNIFKAGLIGLLAIAMGLVIYNRIDAVSRAALVLYPFALVGLLGLPRLMYRAWKDSQTHDAMEIGAKRVLVLGAGRAAEALLRDLRRSGAWEPVGLLDDAEQLHGTKLRGVPVLGALSDASAIARETAARLIVIAMPSLDATAMQRVVSICEGTGLPFRTVPRLVDILEGRSMPGELKEVAIDDLLGRKPVTPDWKLIRGWLGGRTVLVTGAGGSIGSELCRQCARHGAQRIALMEISELALIKSHEALTKAFPDLEILPFLGNCGDPSAIAHALKIVKPDAVFHAAAYKHVPLLEGQLREAIRNNVLVTETMARACRDAKVGTFVFISTDKAVDPANVLGASKRLAEMACQSLDERGGTRFTTVRFGNVLDSAGSVVPLFREQIRSGGPVTVTHPDVTRYFMTIPEACQLIVQAAASAAHASIYTLDMGEPIPIRVLAEQMIRLAGKQPGRDIAIAYTGLRPGEKLHETLFHAEELYRSTAHSKILEARAREVSAESVTRALHQLRQAVADYDNDAITRVLHAAIPEFSPAPDHEAINTVVPFPTREARNHR
ncbi:NDP-sugar epimerase, includes UDP-GlcNAc-inverting 4,6-dehydratase FlaA1 and capsular polysaccharide biosynthesis protein EpsC [Pseudoxanthomonas sp. GM95]|uniref:polysaccharide biosynthesis protein n=1 Tax=Pseudoxanthomonas sp. GM95 TaxID=1881043 RepID=UPI0008BB28D4|nr:nucleoside-diphosphate sugar epimerase/dehydratase [Pseudoxanthomonas sp. GM95]SEL92386.1 NDP-sugar epimerase, includes UDP-GlcNAc-inverting 4,6-dehydratase FlaA1 and capsular polysaccharide biosynthesis protein EpsC [Pseudoxanthomonas sp. GM95]